MPNFGALSGGPDGSFQSVFPLRGGFRATDYYQVQGPSQEGCGPRRKASLHSYSQKRAMD